MLEKVVSSGIFCARNFNKAEIQGESGQWGTSASRGTVAVGQAKNVISQVQKYDNEIGKNTKAAVDALKSAAKTDKFLNGAYKVVDFASKNVNPLICASSVFDVLTSDDKEATLIKDATALTFMFTVEHLMKNHLKDVPKVKGVDKIAEKVMEFGAKYKHGGKIPAILHGLAFVIGSCTAYGLGEKLGAKVAGTVNDKKQN